MAPFQCCVSAYVTSWVFLWLKKIQKCMSNISFNSNLVVLLAYLSVSISTEEIQNYIYSYIWYEYSSLSSGRHAGCSLQICLLCPLRGQACWIQIERWKILSIKGSIFKEAIQETSDLILPECAIVRANITKLVSHCFAQPHNDSTRRIIFHLTAPCQTP